MACRLGLLVTEIAQRHVDVANVEFDDAEARFIGRIARDIALALPVPKQP